MSKIFVLNWNKIALDPILCEGFANALEEDI
jgi:hypothetical protein